MKFAWYESEKKLKPNVKRLSESKQVFHHFEVEKGITHLVIDPDQSMNPKQMINCFYVHDSNHLFIEQGQVRDVKSLFEAPLNEIRRIDIDTNLGIFYVIQQLKKCSA